MKKNKKSFIFIILLFIIMTAAISRFIGFNNPHSLTFDEGLYTRLGLQLKANPSNYTSKPMYEYYTKGGRHLPDYLNMPLFKHPPVFSYLISLSHTLFSPSYLSAFLVSLTFGLVLILVVFYVASYIFNKDVGLLSALLVAIDPIHWLVSQKIWMETTLAALIWISIFFLMRAILDSKNRYFFLAGISTGLAILTKYPAFIIFPIGFSYVLLYNRKVLKSVYFWSWPLISFILFIPWMVWNYKIYKGSFFITLITVQGELKEHFLSTFAMWNLGILLVCALGIYLIFHKKQSYEGILRFIKHRRLPLVIITIAFILFFTRPYMVKGIINMLNINYIPSAGWKMGMFSKEPWYFYLRRLIELSPFYMISFLSLFFLSNFKSKNSPLFVAAFWILLLFISYRSFQCRYILSVVPALLIISSSTIIRLIEKIKQLPANQIKLVAYRIILSTLLIYCFMKTIFIDLYLALPNKVCYF